MRCTRLLCVMGALTCVGSVTAGCSGSRASDAETPDSRTADRDDTPVVSDSRFAQPPPGDDGAERPPPPRDDEPPQPPIDISSLPSGPVSCADCGPAPGYPSWQCPDGSQGGRGPCVKLEDGRCGWLNLVCAASGACAPDECGPAPVPRLFRCPDGVHSGGFDCVRDEGGRCGWTHRACLGRSSVPPSPPPPPAPPPPARESCDPLPSNRVLRTWEVNSICSPGSGPVQPERRLVLSLGDGTHILADHRGCFRARYRQCLSK
jgi:hypothetical protein